MQNLPEIVAQHLEQHHAAYALEAAAGAAGTGTEVHQQAQQYPRDMRPAGDVVAEHTRGGHKRHHLEQRLAETLFEVVAQTGKEQIHNPQRGTTDHNDIELELRVPVERCRLQLEHG